MGRKSNRAIFVILLILIVTVMLWPFLYMISSSFMSFGEQFGRETRLLPRSLSFKPYSDVLFRFDFIRYMKNSFLIGLTTLVLCVLLSVTAAYSLARLQLPGKEIVARMLMLIYFVPGILLLIPLYLMLAKAGLLKNYSGLILAYLAQTVPVAIYLFHNYIKSIPVEIEESALIDGCGRLAVLVRMILPLSLPVLISVGTYIFIIAWNEFLFAYVFIDEPVRFTLTRGLFNLYHSHHAPWDKIMAASTIIVIPVIVLFAFFGKKLQHALLTSGIK